MIQIIRWICFSFLISSLIMGCQSQQTNKQPLSPSHLAVFQHETVWLDTSTSSISGSKKIRSFNEKLKARLKMYGANQIKARNWTGKAPEGLVIITTIPPKNSKHGYQLTILRKNRELISESYPNINEGEQLAINGFLMSIHKKIINAESYF